MKIKCVLGDGSRLLAFFLYVRMFTALVAGTDLPPTRRRDKEARSNCQGITV